MASGRYIYVPKIYTTTFNIFQYLSKINIFNYFTINKFWFSD